MRYSPFKMVKFHQKSSAQHHLIV